MAGLTLAQCEAKLAAWMAADEAVMRNQSYTIDGRTLERADAKLISENIDKWDARCKRMGRSSRGGPTYGYGVSE